jgi:hypothetical protein
VIDDWRRFCLGPLSARPVGGNTLLMISGHILTVRDGAFHKYYTCLSKHLAESLPSDPGTGNARMPDHQVRRLLLRKIREVEEHLEFRGSNTHFATRAGNRLSACHIHFTDNRFLGSVQSFTSSCTSPTSTR